MQKDASFVLRLLSGTERIEPSIADFLAQNVGATSSFWLKRQEMFDAALGRVAKAIPANDAKDWLRTLPLREMHHSGWLGLSSQESRLRAALSYFGVTSPDEWRERYAEHATKYSYRTSRTFKSKLGALSAWLRQAELQAINIKCAKWNRDKFVRGLDEIRKLTRLKSPLMFMKPLRDICAAAGVAVVFVKAPSGCRASGATRFVSKDKALIILSFRYLSDDHFWFSFFHEAGHLVLHGSDSIFVDGEAAETTEKEKEANSFAARILIPLSEFDRLLALRANFKQIVRFAVSIGVSPGIVVGQMQHHGLLGQHQFNRLKRRYSWEQIERALQLTL
jgi:Zn-dependent peptidase ImmA (M78 family)